ncbi:MAG TPA: hypothetical protein PKY82_13080 [Pyrinomonadaceae bacterium]|nr:hypothetical protein [Pyrinomonadaceae bacterium]
MNEKKCPTCGSDMGKGALTSEDVKAAYECWCGETVVELYSEEELPKLAIEANQPTSVSAMV